MRIQLVMLDRNILLNFINPVSGFSVRASLVSMFSVLLLIQSSWILAAENKVVDLATLQWGPPGGGNGFPLGVQTARQGVDPDTGGITYYARFPAGTHYDLHWHTHTEWVVVVAGELSMQLGDEHYDLTVGSYIVIPGDVNHSWTVPAGGEPAVILVRRAGPADFFFVDPIE